MSCRWVVGTSSHLDYAVQAWKQARPQQRVVRIEVPQAADHAFDFSVLDACSAAEGPMFVACDERFGNFKRMELMQAAIERGFALESFVSHSSVVAANAAIGMNVFIDEGVVVGAGSRIDYNCVLQAGARIGRDVHVKSSSWLDLGSTVGHRAVVGAHAILRMGAMVAPGVQVGRHCELGWPQVYSEDVPSRTVFDPRYQEPIRVFGH